MTCEDPNLCPPHRAAAQAVGIALTASARRSLADLLDRPQTPNQEPHRDDHQ